MAINRWGQDIKRGALVMVSPANGARYYAGKVKRLEPPSGYSSAYGRQVMLETGYSVGIDGCTLATARDIFRSKLESIQRASDTHDYVTMQAIGATARDYPGRVITLAFLGVSASDTNRALFPQDHGSCDC